MRKLQRSLGATLIVTGLAGPAVAQSAEQTPPASDVSGQGGSLSKKLNETSGVIHPQDSVDPGMQKTPPATGTMPIMPPPGTPGGRSDVVPK